MPSFPTRTEGPYHGRQRQHRQWSFPTRAEVPETCGSSGNRCCFFSRTHVSRNQKWLSVIYPVFSRVHGSPLPVASKHRPEGVFSEHMPPQYLPAAQTPTDFSNLHGRGQSGKADRSCPARTEGTGISFRRLRPVLLSSPPVPPVCAPPPGGLLRLPRAALLLQAACPPVGRRSAPPTSGLLSGLQRIPPQSPGKSSSGDTPKKNAGNPRTPSPCRMAHGSPHAPCPHGLRSLSVKEKRPSSRRHALVVSSFPHFGRKYPGHAFFLLLPIPSFNKNPQKGRIYLFRNNHPAFMEYFHVYAARRAKKRPRTQSFFHLFVENDVPHTAAFGAVQFYL